MSETILAIEYDEERTAVYRVYKRYTKDSCYAVEHSKSYGPFYHSTGSGLGESNSLTIDGKDYSQKLEHALTELRDTIDDIKRTIGWLVASDKEHFRALCAKQTGAEEKAAPLVTRSTGLAPCVIFGEDA